MTGCVPDIREYYAECDLYIAPIRIGGGTRLKIVEAMAMGKPVVSTTIGTQGPDFQDQKHIVLADSPNQFALAIKTMLSDRTRSAKIAESGKKFVLDNYTWKNLGQQVDQFYRSIV